MSILFFSFTDFSAAQNSKRTLKTTAGANSYLHSLINNFPAKATDIAVAAYAKEHSEIMLQSAKILYDSARQQILEALAEIDNRITYWQYQKDHPWNYFVSKNPLKWVTGPAQEDEIEDNLETLKSHQGELYVFLGRLAQLGSDFNAGYKDTFLADHQQGYAWIDRLLDALIRIKTKNKASKDGSFIACARQLQEKLENVSQFKDELLSDISATTIPPYFARNWFKGGIALLTMGYGYNNVSYGQIADSLDYLKTSANIIVDPVKDIAKNIITPEQSGTVSSYEVQSKLVKDFVQDMGKKYNLAPMSKDVIESLSAGDYSPYREFVEEVGKREQLSLFSPLRWVENLKDYGRGKILGGELDIALLRKQSAALWKVGLSIPALLFTISAYAGYQKLIQKNYTPLRYALININSFFVDPTQQLTAEQQGEMIYLIYMLKRRAEKELPTKKNMRADFIHDLQRLESSEFNVAAKRAIIDDMFRKYEFLGLIQKK
jgi:hypothetical protein